MTAFSRELLALARLELSDVLRSRWLVFSTGVYAVLAGVLVFVGMRESSVLGFSGMNRVMLSFAHVLLLVLPLLALTATTQIVNRAREDGTIELLFSHPLSRTGYLVAVSITRYAVLVVPLVTLFCAMAFGAGLVFDESVPWAMLARTLTVSAALLWAFTGLGLAVSVGARHPARAVTWGLFLWALSVALLDLALIGLLLQWRLDARTLFMLASFNPVQSARLALLSGIETDLGSLGPLGFYLSERVGAASLLALGLAWPITVGTASWLWAHASFRRSDLV
jgi:ABC-type transport system involved in multi-copper enzyme maturation permease subunit